MSDNWPYLMVTIKSAIKENIMNIQFCIFLSLCSLFISIFIIITSFFSDDNTILNVSMAVYYLMMFILIYAVVRTVFSFSGEIENKTLEVLLSLPMKRSTLFIGKIVGLTIAMTPLLIIPLVFYYIILSIVTGAIPYILTLIILQLALLSIATISTIIVVSATLSIVLKRTSFSLVMSILYLLLMIIITPSICNFGNPRIEYNIDYFNVFLLPYTILGAGITSIRANHYIDSYLYIFEIIFCIYIGIIGYLAMKRLEL